MLDTFQSALYQRLQAFELDDPTHEFGFTRHLIKSQGWTLTYAQRAIAEYKKFAFLTVVANHQVVPSDQVDQVWHAHVLLTQSYWEEFCPKVLGKTLHHHPARGGRAERTEFHRLYTQTIASYRQFFGSPPTDIWSPPDVRFGAELKMQRVSLSDHWVIPKRFPHWKFAQPLNIIIIIVCMVTIGWVRVAHGSTIGQVVDDVPANQLVIAICGSAILGLILRYVIRSPGQQPQKPQLDTYQIAYLAGGASRAVELAITQLVHQGYLRPNVRNRTLAIEKRLPPEATTLEQQVMQQVHRTPSLKDLRQVYKYEANFLQRTLEQERLLMTGWAAFMGVSFGLFILITILVGIFIALVMNLLSIQLSDMNIFGVLHRSIGIVTLCCLVPGGRTRWGSRILADIRKNHDVYDVTQRFALYGYTVLSGGALDDLKQIFKAEAEAASGGCGCGC
jgi:uncharacterized protein (TIGR04222 family)